jgi:hypothetical protein
MMLTLIVVKKTRVDYLYDYFKPLGIVGAPPKESKSIIKPSGNTRISYGFATFTLPFFTNLYSQWYKQIDGKNIKTVPNNIDQFLSPIAHYCSARSAPLLLSGLPAMVPMIKEIIV